MADDANPAPDDERLAAIATSLADQVEAVVPTWIERLVVERVAAWRGEVSDAVRAEAVVAGEAAQSEVAPAMRSLLATDIDEQVTNPLELLRVATHHAHAVLDRQGMPPVRRDEFSERSFPADVYDLMPATWSDVDPSLQDPGIAWGAAKAFVHKARRRAEGRT